MRIVQVVKRRQRRGAEVFAAELSDALVKRGHEVVLLGLGDPVGDDLCPTLAVYEDLDLPLRRPLEFRSIRRVASRLRDLSPEVVQANGSDTLKYSVLARSLVRGSWKIVYRNIGLPSDWIRGPLHRLVNRLLVSRVDHVVSVSKASASNLTSTYGLSDQRITVIPQTAAIPEFMDRSAARASLVAIGGLSEDAEIIVHVGSFTPEKNHQWMIESFAQIARQRPASVLVLIGDGPERNRAEEQVGHLGLVGRVFVLGTRIDAADMVGGADLFVLPSATEGIPAVLLEAGARGVPAVATAVGGVPEVVENGRTGILVQPGDRSGFVASVCGVLDDPERRRSLGDNARRMVMERYDLDSAVTRYASLYAEIVG